MVRTQQPDINRERERDRRIETERDKEREEREVEAAAADKFSLSLSTNIHTAYYVITHCGHSALRERERDIVSLSLYLVHMYDRERESSDTCCRLSVVVHPLREKERRVPPPPHLSPSPFPPSLLKNQGKKDEKPKKSINPEFIKEHGETLLQLVSKWENTIDGQKKMCSHTSG